MTILDYYIKHRFDNSKYLTGVDDDPVVEIAKAVAEKKIKCVFVMGDAVDQNERWLHTEVSAYPPYYLSVARFSEEMSMPSHIASEESQLQPED